MRLFVVRSVPLLMLAWLEPAWADTHAVTIRNGTQETVRRIEIGTSDNRLRSQIPPGAVARITYSTGCQATVRIGFEGGRTEEHAGVDVCSDPVLVAGQDGVAGVAMGAAPAAPTGSIGVASGPKTAVSLPVKAPPPVVPPWTGKSITKRFGGME